MKDKAFIETVKGKRKIKLNYHSFYNNILFLLQFTLFIITNIKNPNYLISCNGEIHLVVDNNFQLGDNLKNQISGTGIIVNGKNRPKDRYLFLNESLNNIAFRLSNTLNSFEDMFKNDTSIISVDFSEIDIKIILSMKNMFSGCINLKTVIFGNFEATALRGMNSMFKGCTSLIYLQLFKLPIYNYIITTNLTLKVIS